MPLETPIKIIKQAGYGIMATEMEGQPKCRPMAFVIPPGRFVLWSSTWACSGKAAELKNNPRVEICFVGEGKVHLRIEGTARIDGGSQKKAQLLELNPKVGRHFKGPDDPNFVHIEIIPSLIRWMGPGFGEYTMEQIEK